MPVEPLSAIGVVLAVLLLIMLILIWMIMHYAGQIWYYLNPCNKLFPKTCPAVPVATGSTSGSTSSFRGQPPTAGNQRYPPAVPAHFQGQPPAGVKRNPVAKQQQQQQGKNKFQNIAIDPSGNSLSGISNISPGAWGNGGITALNTANFGDQYGLGTTSIETNRNPFKYESMPPFYTSASSGKGLNPSVFPPPGPTMNPMTMASNMEAMQQSEFFNNMNGGDPGSEIMSFMAGNGGQSKNGFQAPSGGQKPMPSGGGQSKNNFQEWPTIENGYGLW